MIKLIYIVGYGHSGSTLLNLILGSSKKVYSLGEMASLKYCLEKTFVKRFFENRKLLCTCGNDFFSCEFWRDLKNNINSKALYHPGINKFLLFLSIILKVKKDFEEEKLFEILLKKAKKFKTEEVEYLLDSSKDPFRLLYLKMIKNIDLTVLYVIRDGRGVINSCEKTGVSTIRTFIFWVLTNLIIRIMAYTFPKEKFYPISYDLFVNNLNEYIKIMNKRMKLNIDVENLIKNINNQKYHNFHGNIMGWKAIDSIHYDQSWIKRMSIRKQKLLSLLTLLPNIKWVYNRKLIKEKKNKKNI